MNGLKFKVTIQPAMISVLFVFRKLQEVKDRLNQLRDLVQYYQTGHEFIHENADDGDMSSMLAFSDYEDPELMRNLK